MPDERASPAGVVPFLRAHRAFGRLWAARAVSFLGDSIGLVALLLYVAEHEKSGIAVALLMIAGDFAPNLLSPLAGALADRASARWLMPCCEIAQAGITVAIALALPGLPVLLPLVAVRGTIATVFGAASGSVVPSLVPADQLPKANAGPVLPVRRPPARRDQSARDADRRGRGRHRGHPGRGVAPARRRPSDISATRSYRLRAMVIPSRSGSMTESIRGSAVI